MANPLKKYETPVEISPSSSSTQDQLTGEMPTVTTLLQRKKLQGAAAPEGVVAPIESLNVTKSDIVAPVPPLAEPAALKLEEVAPVSPATQSGDAIVIELDIPGTVTSAPIPAATPSNQDPPIEAIPSVSLASPPVVEVPNPEITISTISADEMKNKLERRSQFRMARWNKENLQNTPGPLARALEILATLGAKEVIYFESHMKNEWQALAAFAERDRMACWTGLSLELPDELESAIDFAKTSRAVVSLESNSDWADHLRRNLILNDDARIYLIALPPLPLDHSRGQGNASPGAPSGSMNSQMKNSENQIDPATKKAMLCIHTNTQRFDRICKSIQPLLASIDSG